MKRYEYLVTTQPREPLIEWLNRLGLEGWHLSTTTEDYDGVTFYFARLLP